MTLKTIKIAYKISFGLLGLAAITTEIVTLISREKFDPANFFSYFTILSNIFAFIMLLIGAYALIASKKSKSVDMLRGASTLYMVITGIVFATLLANIKGATFTAVPWDNIVLHYMIPIVMLLDWLIDKPPTRIDYRKSFLWLIFPVIYVIYSLIRGAVTKWYPYPFLDPQTGGYVAIVITSLGITFLGIIITALLVKGSHRLIKN